MDTLDIIIVAAAGVGIVAFIALAVVLVMQGRSLKRLEERIGPPVPPGAAPSLERVRAITSQPEMRVHVEGLDDAAVGPAQPRQAPVGAEKAGQAAAVAASSEAAERSAERRQQRPEATSQRSGGASRGGGRPQQPKGGDSSPGGGNGALYALIGIVVVAVLVGLGWFFFLRGGDSAPAPANTGTTASSSTSTSGGSSSTTATAPDTAGPIPDSVPPVANKAAYTVAVLNASGVAGAAANRVAPRVQAAGYTLGVVDNATQQDVTTSEVQYVPGRKEVAWNLAKDLGITAAGPVNSLSEGRIGTADVVVVVGKDLSK